MNFSAIALLAISLGCPIPQFFNNTPYPKNKVDVSQMQVAMNRCGQLYKNSPCLKTFTKTGIQDYKAVCGSK